MFAVILIPNFSLQAVLRQEPDLRERAIALVDPELPRPLIVQLSSAARDCGVCEGLTASQATARCGELIIKSRALPLEKSANEILLQTACAFSPNIESTAPGLCTMELKGLTFHSKEQTLEQWMAKIVEAMAQFYLETKIGLAATPELALLAARAAEPVLMLSSSGKHPTPNIQHPTSNDIPSGEPLDVGCSMLDVRCSQGILESFPISTLEPTPEILAILHRWGIQTIGALLALGRDNVIERLGPEIAELFNRVSPDSSRPLKLVAPPEEFVESMEFEHEVETTEPLLFVLRRFVEQLSRRLELIYLVVAELHLQLSLASAAKYEHAFKIPAPTGNIDILFRMLQTHLEIVRTDSPIISLRLAAKPAKPEAQQFGLFESTLRDPNQFAETLARLTALSGPDRIGTPQMEASHRPDAFKMAQTFIAADSNTKRNNGTENSATAPASVTSLSLRRFRPPHPSHIEFRDNKPALLRSEIFIGAIVETRGPFFSSGNWWDTGHWAREEWDVEITDGSLFRIFRSADGCFVEGVYD